MNSIRFLLVAALVTIAMSPVSVSAEVKLLARGKFAGNLKDKSGQTGKLAENTPADQLGGFSAIAYTGKDDIYWILSDRGPADGQTPSGVTKFACRAHKFRIKIPAAGQPVQPELLDTILLKNEAGQQLVGSTGDFDTAHPDTSLRFDPEALRVGRDGSLFLSDEYGPRVGKFNLTGKRVKRLPLPAAFAIAQPNADPALEMMNNHSGRQPNAGLEGMAISPDGSRLFAIFQRALIQDHGKRDHGENVRIAEIPLNGAPGRQFIYRLDDVKNGVNEFLAINDHEFLAIERDSLAGDMAVFKKIMHVDLFRKPNQLATDVSSIPELPEGKLPDGVHHVRKEVFLDLLDPVFGLKGPQFPEKHEGICFGPRLGHQITLIAVSDNDFVTAEAGTIQIFTIPAETLPEFVPQQFGN